MNNPPCRNCTARTAICHVSCVAYREWVAGQKTKRKSTTAEADGYIKELAEKNRRRKRR